MDDKEKQLLVQVVQHVYAKGLHGSQEAMLALAFEQLVARLIKPAPKEAPDVPK